VELRRCCATLDEAETGLSFVGRPARYRCRITDQLLAAALDLCDALLAPHSG